MAKQTPTAKHPDTRTTKPNKPETKNLTPDETESKISELVQRLQAATLVGEKKAIRRQLRSLGHKGGLASVSKQ